MEHVREADELRAFVVEEGIKKITCCTDGADVPDLLPRGAPFNFDGVALEDFHDLALGEVRAVLEHRALDDVVRPSHVDQVATDREDALHGEDQSDDNVVEHGHFFVVGVCVYHWKNSTVSCICSKVFSEIALYTKMSENESYIWEWVNGKTYRKAQMSAHV